MSSMDTLRTEHWAFAHIHRLNWFPGEQSTAWPCLMAHRTDHSTLASLPSLVPLFTYLTSVNRHWDDIDTGLMRLVGPQLTQTQQVLQTHDLLIVGHMPNQLSTTPLY